MLVLLKGRYAGDLNRVDWEIQASNVPKTMYYTKVNYYLTYCFRHISTTVGKTHYNLTRKLLEV
jgi:hypothetical protein